MSMTPYLPDDPAECRRFLDALRRIEELEHILDETAADYDRLKEEHAELSETLALLRRYLFSSVLVANDGLTTLARAISSTSPPRPNPSRSRPPRPITRHRRDFDRPAPPDTLGSLISRTSASSTTSPRRRRPAPAAGLPRSASARTSPANSSSSRPGWR